MMPARPATISRLALAATILATLSLAACGKKGDVTDLRPPPPAEQPAQGTGG